MNTPNATGPLPTGIAAVTRFVAAAIAETLSESMFATSRYSSRAGRSTDKNQELVAETACGDSRAGGVGRQSEHGPDIGEERVVVVRVSSNTVVIRSGPVKFGPVCILQADAEVQPWPEGRAAVAERQVGNLEDPVGTVRAPGERAVKCRVRSAANRHSTCC